MIEVSVHGRMKGDEMALRRRVAKLEVKAGLQDRFSEFFQKYLSLIDGSSRCLPCEDTKDPALNARFDRLFERYPAEKEQLSEMCDKIEKQLYGDLSSSQWSKLQ